MRRQRPRVHLLLLLALEDGVLQAGFTLPTGPTKPAGSGTGIPDRFGRKPVKFKFKVACSTGSDRLTGRFDRFTGRFNW